MGYSVELTTTALTQLRKLDRPIARRILDYLDEVEMLDEPRARGKALVGPRAGLWRYRVGDHRVICDVRDGELVVIALEIVHRSVAYD